MKLRLILLVFLASITGGMVSAATVWLKGDTYEQRASALIDCMVASAPQKGGEIKYLSPFYIACILKNERKDEAVALLMEMYNKALADPQKFYDSGSNMDFTAHATMHGYLLTKNLMPENLRAKIREFMEMGKYVRKNVTLNMRMMQECSGYLCAEDWPDFVDADGNDATAIKSSVRDDILSTMRSFITDNCPEADAFTYIVTNLQYLRMLAEFCKDEEIRQVAENAYQHVAAQMLLPWNQGLYCANPPRSKGWNNLQTGNLGADVQINQIAWLYYGSQEARPVNASVGNSDNFGCFNFWMAYQRDIKPSDMLAKLEAVKAYPYSFEASRHESSYSYARYTFQSDNYGLSTQHIEGKASVLNGFQYTYAFKETRNLHLVWQSVSSPYSVFCVCHDNPERPQRYQTVSNKAGYGENPYHRVFGRGRSAIGMYVVADDYMDNPVFYQMYAPFTRQGILLRRIEEINGYRWVVCHTGSIMFAFTTPEEWKWETTGGKYAISNHDVLRLSDENRRRGSWVLETTEITDDYSEAGGNRDEELSIFIRQIASRCKIELSADYETSATPTLTYTNIDGDRLEMQYFSPETAYSGQYRINGKAVMPNLDYISLSPYLEQKKGSNVMTLHMPDGNADIDFCVPRLLYDASPNDAWSFLYDAVVNYTADGAEVNMGVDSGNGKFRADLQYKGTGLRFDPSADKYLAIEFVGNKPQGNISLEIHNPSLKLARKNMKLRNFQGNNFKHGDNTIVYCELAQLKTDVVDGEFASYGDVAAFNSKTVTIKIADNTEPPHSYKIRSVRVGESLESLGFNAEDGGGASGIGIISSDNTESPAEYYDLMGRRIYIPQHGGIYILRQGDRVKKVRL